MTGFLAAPLKTRLLAWTPEVAVRLYAQMAAMTDWRMRGDHNGRPNWRQKIFYPVLPLPLFRRANDPREGTVHYLELAWMHCVRVGSCWVPAP